MADRAVVKPYKLERRNTTVVHIDVDPAEIGKNLGTTVPLVGDVHVIFENLLQYEIPEITQHGMKNWQRRKQLMWTDVILIRIL